MGEKYINTFIKKIAVKLALFSLQLVRLLKRAVTFIFSKLLKKPVFAIGGLFYVIALTIYKIYWRFAQKLRQRFGPTKNKFFFPFLNKYIPHILVISLTLLVATHNLLAAVVPNNFGQNTILYSIVSQSSEGAAGEEIVVESNLDNVNTPVSYGYGGNAVAAIPQIDENSPIDSPDLATTAIGGSSLVKPSLGSEVVPLKDKLRDNVEQYTVQDGDTIGSIATDFGITVNTILWANNLGSRDIIKPGQSLAILPTSGVSHTVKSGDTLQKIANLYSVDPDEILTFNELSSANDIKAGQNLIIPEGAPLAVAVAAPIAPVPVTPHIAPIKDIFTVLPSKPPASAPVASSGKYLWPTSGHVITQYYSWHHTGVDIDGDFTSPIYAAEAGVINTAGWNNGGYGIQIIIDHGNGYKTRYAHLSKMLVSVGDQVARGQQIGVMGSTGHSTGSHLHFEVMINNIRQNPLSYIK